MIVNEVHGSGLPPGKGVLMKEMQHKKIMWVFEAFNGKNACHLPLPLISLEDTPLADEDPHVLVPRNVYEMQPIHMSKFNWNADTYVPIVAYYDAYYEAYYAAAILIENCAVPIPHTFAASPMEARQHARQILAMIEEGPFRNRLNFLRKAFAAIKGKQDAQKTVSTIKTLTDKMYAEVMALIDLAEDLTYPLHKIRIDIEPELSDKPVLNEKQWQLFREIVDKINHLIAAVEGKRK